MVFMAEYKHKTQPKELLPVAIELLLGIRQPKQPQQKEMVNDGKIFPDKEDFGNPAVYELLSKTANKYPESTCIHYQGRNMTYAEVDEASSRLASALAGLGVNKGDRVAIMLPNTPQFVISYFGILKAGGVVVPCSMLYTPSELEHQLRDSGATIVIGLKDVITKKVKENGREVKKSDDYFSSIEGCTDNLSLKHIITTSVTDYLPSAKRSLAPLVSALTGVKTVSRPGTIDFVKLIGSSDPMASFPTVNSKEDIAVLQYTGGTTGVSKGAMLTHYNLYSNAAYTAKTFPMTKDDISLCVLPLFHIYGATATMNSALYAGSKLVLLPEFHVQDVMKAIQKQGVTLFCGVPAIYNAIINSPKVGRFDLRSVRVCMSGS